MNRGGTTPSQMGAGSSSVSSLFCTSSCSILCRSLSCHRRSATVHACCTPGLQAAFDPSIQTRMQQHGSGACVTGKSFGFKIPAGLLGQDADDAGVSPSRPCPQEPCCLGLQLDIPQGPEMLHCVHCMPPGMKLMQSLERPRELASTVKLSVGGCYREQTYHMRKILDLPGHWMMAERACMCNKS